jgi:hypothetical protein
MDNDEHAFQRFYMDFVDWNNDGLLSTWWINVVKKFSMVFFIYKVKTWWCQTHCKCLSTRVFTMCICDYWYATRRKWRCNWSFKGFAHQELMNATKIICPQHWLNFDKESTFPTHLALLMVQYCFELFFGDEGSKILALLNK